jgi:hypothetical protein
LFWSEDERGELQPTSRAIFFGRSIHWSDHDLGGRHRVYCSADQVGPATRRLLRAFGHDRFQVIAVDDAGADQRQLVPAGSRRSFGE